MDLVELADISVGAPDRLQVIDADKTFTTDLSAQIERWGFRDAGFDYTIVAVLGSQSTGKSTLLNGLFGTSFEVMNSSRRQQTTKGLWMCKATNVNIMVMDVEGADGRERGEDQDFERKAALFSLSSSEILVINLWEHQVGLYHGGNMALLKVIFEVNLALLGTSSQSQSSIHARTRLLFVIRDHTGVTSLTSLEETLTADVQRIWDSLYKPPALQDPSFAHFFDLTFVALPNKLSESNRFDAAVRQLRQRFVDKSHASYLFKEAYRRGIPADGVAFYMKNIWEQILANQDLDLPNHRELLARFRCDIICSEALNRFNEEADSQRGLIATGRVVDGLGGFLRNRRTQVLEQYDCAAARYHHGTYSSKRRQLVSAITSAASPLLFGQRNNLRKACVAGFERDVREAMRRMKQNTEAQKHGSAWVFKTAVESVWTRYKTLFVAEARDAVLMMGSQDGFGDSVAALPGEWVEDPVIQGEEPGSAVDYAWKEELNALLCELELKVPPLRRDLVEMKGQRSCCWPCYWWLPQPKLS